LILLKRHSVEPVRWSLWAYDLDRKTASKVRDNAVPASWRLQASPLKDILAIRYPLGDEGPRTLALLNLATGAETEIAKVERSFYPGVQWDPTGERMSFIVRRTDHEGRASYILTVYSVAAGKAVAERTITDAELTAYMYRTAWMPDGRSLLALDAKGRCLRILGPDLQEAGRIDLPARIQEPVGLVNVDDEMLLEDEKDGRSRTLWRLDLEKKRWKRIY
jgi:hypothetical protein